MCASLCSLFGLLQRKHTKLVEQIHLGAMHDDRQSNSGSDSEADIDHVSCCDRIRGRILISDVNMGQDNYRVYYQIICNGKYGTGQIYRVYSQFFFAMEKIVHESLELQGKIAFHITQSCY